MTDPVFKKGDRVKPVYTSGYHLSMGKVYVVVSYDPPFSEETFTWPAYVETHDDRGTLIVAHARRFKLS